MSCSPEIPTIPAVAVCLPHPAAFVRSPLGTVRDGFIGIFAVQHISMEEAGFLDGGDVYPHSVVDVRSVTALLGDELNDVLWWRPLAVQAGHVVEQWLRAEPVLPGPGFCAGPRLDSSAEFLGLGSLLVNFLLQRLDLIFQLVFTVG